MSLKASLTALCPSKNILSPSPNQPRGARGQGLNVFRGRGGGCPEGQEANVEADKFQ